MALLPGSPAIGAGEIVGGITTDQRSFPMDSPNPDIGAFQIQAQPMVTPSTVGMLKNAPTLTITGTGFDTTASNNTVSFNVGPRAP